MKIGNSQFSGIFPRLDPESLPESAAQVAQNVDLTSSKLVPGTAAAPFVANNDGTNLNSGIPTADWKQISSPAKVSLNELKYLFDPLDVSIRAYIWIRHLVDGEILTELVTYNIASVGTANYNWTDTGLTITIRGFEPQTGTLPYSIDPYEIIGPRYQFRIAGGGGIFMPETCTPDDPEIPAGLIQLTDDDGQTYGYFQVTDVRGPSYNETIVSSKSEGIKLTFWYDSGDITFNVELNYTDRQVRNYYYVQTRVDSAGDEGPPSEISDMITVMPGTYASLATVSKGRLYRSTGGSSEFHLLDELTATYYYDKLLYTQATALPPYGNYPTGMTKSGSVIHPAHFAVNFNGDEVWFSDFYRFWVWPEEYVIPVDSSVQALAITGSTIIVFTQNHVYAFSGSHPEYMSKSLVTDSRPLLNQFGVAQVDQQVYWVCADGVAAFGAGSGAGLVTESHFTRKQWQALTPASMTVKSQDETIFIEGGTANIRLDLTEDLARVSTFTALTGVSLTWRSREFIAPSPVAWVYVRVRAAGYPVTLRLLANSVQVAEKTLPADEIYAVPVLRAETRWSYEIVSAYTVDEVMIATHPVELH
jgi:hypothetical protein